MKKIIKTFLLLSLLAFGALFGVIGWQFAGAKQANAPYPTRTQSAPPSPIAAPWTPTTCRVSTGVDVGTVNLRECKGAACGQVLDILTEGESLTILTAGEWMNVTTARGVAGWLSSKYCKGK